MKHTVLVTGGARGIGAAIVCAFARASHRVIIGCNNSGDEARDLANRLCLEGCSAAIAQGDLSDREQAKAVVSAARDAFGAIDILINNAGVSLPQNVLPSVSEEDWRRVFAVNMDGAFYVTQAVLPEMISRRRGSIVNVSSMWGVIGGSCEVAYSASKAALIGFTKSLAKEVAPSGVRVNCVAPGLILTRMNAALTPEDLEAFRLETPLETLGTPEDVANAVMFLALESARFITGQTLCVDGGVCI